MRRVGWLSWTFDPRIASIRYRCLLPAAGLRPFGWEPVYLDTPSATTEQLDSLDCLVFVKTLDPKWLPVALAARAKGKPVILDLCDNVFIPGYPDTGEATHTDAFRAFATCASTIVTNGPALSSVVRQLSPVAVPIVDIPDQFEQRRAVQELVEAHIEHSRTNRHNVVWTRPNWHKLVRKVRRRVARARATSDSLMRSTGPLIRLVASGSKVLPAPKLHPRDDGGDQSATQATPRRRIIWFGNSGGPHSDYGMSSILRVAPHLHKISQEIPFELVVASDDRGRYERVIQPLPFPTRFAQWDVLGIYDEIAASDLAIIPNSDDEFCAAKSANRAALALSLGTPVVASPVASLEPLRGCIGIDDWTTNIRSYLTDPARRERDLGNAHALIEQLYSPLVIAARWDEVLNGSIEMAPTPSGAAEPHRPFLTFVIHLQQDLDLLLPVIQAALCRPECDVRVLVLSSPAGLSPRIIASLDRLGIRYRLVDRSDVLNGSAPCFQPDEAVITASESSLAEHRAAYVLSRRAAGACARTYTVQHGVDNIGLTYFDATHGPDVFFASDVVFTWEPAARLPEWVSAETRRKSVGIGRTARPVPAPLPLPIPAGRPIIGIFENLHWHRYDSVYREAFVEAAVTLANARPECRILLKPHHAGKWGIHLVQRLAETSGNIILASPDDPAWEPFTAPQIVPSLAAVVTTPSTVALDAALAGVPVAVVAGSSAEPTAYDPLPKLCSPEDWITFLDRALEGDLDLIEAMDAFVAKTVLPGDAVERLLDHVLRDANGPDAAIIGAVPEREAGADPRVSVIIVTFNSENFIVPCLRSLQRQTFAAFEVTIWDNNSADETFARASRACAGDHRFRLVRSAENLGFAGGNNRAIAMARAPWIALLNPDTIAADNWLACLMEATQRYPDIAMFGSTQLQLFAPQTLDGTGDVYSIFGLAWRSGIGQPASQLPPEGQTFSPCAAAAMYSTRAVRECSGFDERFFCYFEDVDLAFRMRLRGYECIQLMSAVVYHAGSGSGGRGSFSTYLSVRNSIWTYFKNTPAILLLITLPLGVFGLWSWYKHQARKGDAKAAKRGLRDAVRKLPKILRDRSRVQRQRRVSAVKIARALCWSWKRCVSREAFRIGESRTRGVASQLLSFAGRNASSMTVTSAARDPIFVTFHVGIEDAATALDVHPHTNLANIAYLEMIELLFRSARVFHPCSSFTILTTATTNLNGIRIRFERNNAEVRSSHIMLDRAEAQLRYIEQSDFKRPIILVDSDILVNGSLDELWREDFDIGLTWRWDKIMPINGGMLIVNNKRPEIARAFFRRYVQTYQTKYCSDSKWYGDQLALRDCLGMSCYDIMAMRGPPIVELDGCRIRLLPCKQFNHSPENKLSQIVEPLSGPVILHFKGARKRLMPLYWRAHLLARASPNPWHRLTQLRTRGQIRTQAAAEALSLNGSDATSDARNG